MKIRNLVAGCGVLLAVQAGAQAVNDSCASATDLGTLGYSQWCLFDHGSGVSGTYPFTDSTAMAGPEFPYPAMTLPCSGYASVLTVPSNDVWYAFRPTCFFAIEVKPGPFYVTDTVHIGVWHGPDCGQLVPLKCYTVAANTLLSDSVIPFYQGTYYLQISGPSLSSLSRFSICVRQTHNACSPSFYSYSEPTPVLCFPYLLTTGSAPGIGFNGSATLALNEAFAPYTVVWSDGITDSTSRPDLPVGEYHVTVTSAEGCTEVIEVNILVDPTVGVQQYPARPPVALRSAHGVITVDGLLATDVAGLVLFDMRGRQMGSWIVTNDVVFPVGDLPVGLYVGHLLLADRTILALPFPVLP